MNEFYSSILVVILTSLLGIFAYAYEKSTYSLHTYLFIIEQLKNGLFIIIALYLMCLFLLSKKQDYSNIDIFIIILLVAIIGFSYYQVIMIIRWIKGFDWRFLCFFSDNYFSDLNKASNTDELKGESSYLNEIFQVEMLKLVDLDPFRFHFVKKSIEKNIKKIKLVDSYLIYRLIPFSINEHLKRPLFQNADDFLRRYARMYDFFNVLLENNVIIHNSKTIYRDNLEELLYKCIRKEIENVPLLLREDFLDEIFKISKKTIDLMLLNKEPGNPLNLLFISKFIKNHTKMVLSFSGNSNFDIVANEISDVNLMIRNFYEEDNKLYENTAEKAFYMTRVLRFIEIDIIKLIFEKIISFDIPHAQSLEYSKDDIVIGVLSTPLDVNKKINELLSNSNIPNWCRNELEAYSNSSKNLYKELKRSYTPENPEKYSEYWNEK